MIILEDGTLPDVCSGYCFAVSDFKIKKSIETFHLCFYIFFFIYYLDINIFLLDNTCTFLIKPVMEGRISVSRDFSKNGIGKE